MNYKHSGFTLVELIVVILLLGVIGTFTFNYIGFGARIYTDTVGREQAVSQSRFALQRLVVEVQNSVPRSVRMFAPDIETSCLEFVPTITSGQYLDIPLPGNPNSDFIAVMPTLSVSSLTSAELFVYASEPELIYTTSDLRRKTIGSVSANTPADGLMTVTFSSANSFFATQSIGRRFYVGGDSIVWCHFQATNTLERAVNSGLLSAPTLPSGFEVMARDIVNDNTTPIFKIFEPTLQRNNIVQIDMRLMRTGTTERIQLSHEVFIPNVP